MTGQTVIVTTSPLPRSTGNTAGRAYRACQQVIEGFTEIKIDVQTAIFTGEIEQDQLPFLIELLDSVLKEMAAPVVGLYTCYSTYFVGRAEEEPWLEIQHYESPQDLTAIDQADLEIEEAREVEEC